MLVAVRFNAAVTPGIPSVTSDSMPGMVSLIAADTESAPATEIGDGGVGKTSSVSLAAAATRRAGSTASGSAIAASLLFVSHQEILPACKTRNCGNCPASRRRGQRALQQ